MTNSFDDRSVKRIARTVRVVEKSPVLSPTYRRRNRSRAGSSTGAVFPAIIVSGGNGIYLANTLNSNGEVLENSVTVVASRATAYDLAADNRIVGVLLPTTTA